jgi:hypothetical protein
VVSDGHRLTQAQVGRGDGGRSEHRGKKGLIDLGYHVAEAVGIPAVLLTPEIVVVEH